MDNYELKELIGKGSFGIVNKAIDKRTGNFVAMKIITIKEYKEKELKNFRTECALHKKLSHRNIINMVESFETPYYIHVVTDLADTDLHKFLKSRKRLAEEHMQRITWDLLSALYYLHSNRVMHRDLKPQNILLDSQGYNAKLCDFGLARSLTRDTYLLHSIKGTPLYMAPEILDEKLYDQQTELWSLGCILYETLLGQPPFRGKTFIDLKFKINRQPIAFPKASEECLIFLKGLLERDPEKRSTWDTILKQDFVKDHIILSEITPTENPLTAELSQSQTLAKEKQRDEINLKKYEKKMCKFGPKYNAAVLQLDQQPQTTDNESISSQDSINAIIQTDVENIETDAEGPKPEHRRPSKSNNNTNLIIKRFTENFAISSKTKTDAENDLMNSNLVIGKMADNFNKDHIGEVNSDGKSNDDSKNEASTSNRCKDLEKKKLSNNLDNFSIRLANNTNLNENEQIPESSPKAEASKLSKTKEKESDIKPDVSENIQSTCIENEEWLAFIRKTMHEVYNKETDSLKDQNLVGMIVSILRNPNASTKVIRNVVELLCMPLVLSLSADDLDDIKVVYEQVKLVPNLIFASKIIFTTQKSVNHSLSSTASSIPITLDAAGAVYMKTSELSDDQLMATAHIYELVCFLVHTNDPFLMQFCDSVYIIANDLIIHILSEVVDQPAYMKLCSVLISLLCYTLRELPENADMIEKIIFNPNVDVNTFLQINNPLVKMRICMFLRILGRFSSFSLQNAWTSEWKESLEALRADDNPDVRKRAESVIDEFSYLSFYT